MYEKSHFYIEYYCSIINYKSVFSIQSLNHSSAYGYDLKSLKASKKSREKYSLSMVT